MDIHNQVAVITGAAGGIGRALAVELGKRGARTLALVDHTECVATTSREVNEAVGRTVAIPFAGDVTNPEFRQRVFDKVVAEHGLVTVCVPAAGITRDDLTVRLDKTTGQARIYPVETFR